MTVQTIADAALAADRQARQALAMGRDATAYLVERDRLLALLP